MMAQNLTGPLVGSEIHGFHTLQDLDVESAMVEAKSRWLRPNEIHAILSNCDYISNYKYFKIRVKPVNLPKSGTVVLFNRKMLRNFRKDGHNWKRKNDGKTVKESHEYLKIGNEERIHVYYAHGQDNPSFVRRCYWLLDKSLEHIVLVHYRQESQGSPATPVNPTRPLILLEDLDSGTNSVYLDGLNDNLTVKSYEQMLPEINAYDWDGQLFSNVNTTTIPYGGNEPGLYQQNQSLLNGSFGNVARNPSAGIFSFGSSTPPISGSSVPYSFPVSVIPQNHPSESSLTDLPSQNSFETLMNNGISDMQWSVEPSFCSFVHESFSSPVMDPVFNLTVVFPKCAPSTVETEVLVFGSFRPDYQHLAKSNLVCVCGNTEVLAEIVQDGVYRCLVHPHPPGFVNFYMSFDGHKISRVFNFEYRSCCCTFHPTAAPMEPSYNWNEFQPTGCHGHKPISQVDNLEYTDASMKQRYNRNEFRLQMRLATHKSPDVFYSKASPSSLIEARKFALKTSFISKRWQHLMKSTDGNTTPFPQVKDTLFEIALKTKLKESLLERIALGCKTTGYDAQGQGVIHLCAVFGYTWPISLYSWSGLSMDFRDKFGWTALLCAAYNGMEKMVAARLSCGARPNLVTDPTPQNPGGCTAADLAYMKGNDGLAAYLSEKFLVEQFNNMSLAGNISGTHETTTTDPVNSENLTEDQLYLKDTLAAYRTAAEAAAPCIQAAFRDQAYNLQSKAIGFSSPAHMRRQAIKIQAAFRGFQTRKQYRKIIWSVGVLEKAILRWRLKKKGFRGPQVNPVEDMKDEKQEIDVEEDFFKISRKQAEERVERSVVHVQAMFCSKKAQQEYSSVERFGGNGQPLGETDKSCSVPRKCNKSSIAASIGLGGNGQVMFCSKKGQQVYSSVERFEVHGQAMFCSKKAQQEYSRMKMAHSQQW